MSLNRLIDLAKRTGDRLIVHDPVNGHDFVILDIDAYEEFLNHGRQAVDYSAENIPPEEADAWQSAGEILKDRYPSSGPGVSYVETMWGEPKEAGEPMHDASAERSEKQPVSQEDAAADEPVFYEEPIA